MIIYRPQRGNLTDSMLLKKEFETEEEMKRYIEAEWDGFVKAEEIVIYGDPYNERSTGWRDSRSVCAKAFGGEDNIAKYGFPQCIGFCATDYK